MDTNPQDIVISGFGPVCALAGSIDDLQKEPAHMAGEDWFDPKTHLGKRGWKYLSLSTRYVLGAAKSALTDAAFPLDFYSPEQLGIVVGTNFGAISTHTEFHNVIRTEGADSLSPMSAPNFAINLVASHASSKHSFRAFNITLTNPLVAGIEAVLIGARALSQDRARAVLAGATEEPAPSAGAQFVGLDRTREGAMMMLLEHHAAVADRDGQIRAAVERGGTCFFPPDRLADRDGRTKLYNIVAGRLDRWVQSDTATLALAPVLVGDIGSAVNEIIDQYFKNRRITVSQLSGEYTQPGMLTVSPLVAAARQLLQQDSVLVAATSPLGHIAFLKLSRIKPYRFRSQRTYASQGVKSVPVAV